METLNFELTPQQRAALTAHPGQPIHICDGETGKIYMLVEQGAFPEIEEEYIRKGIELARTQIARGEISTASVEEIISKAQTRNQ